MKFERLGNIVKISSGGTPKRNNPYFFEDGDILWVKTGDLKQKYIDDTPEKITINAVQNSSAKIFPAKTVLVAMYGATIGACSILKTEASTNQACAAILPTEKVNHEFLYYYFKSIQKQLISKGQGGGQPNISSQILKDTRIPIFSLPDQIRIATILSKTETLINKRKESIALLDEFLKSIFIQKFIDNKFPFVRLELLTTKITDGEHKKPDYKESGMPFISVVNISKGYLNFENCKFITREDHTKFNKRCNPEFEDIIYTKVGATYGRAILVDVETPFSLYVSVALIKPDKSKINPYFLKAAINHPFVKRQADKAIKGAGVPDLHLKEIKSFKIPLPPLTLQNQFAQIVVKADSIKSQYQTSLQELENLYGSLSQRAFKGELDLSKLEVLYEEEYSSRDNDRTEPDDFNKPINFENISVQIKKQKYYGGGDAVVSKPEEKKIASKIKEESKSIWRITRITGKTSGIRFSDIEGNAILNDVFKKKRYGFTFQELEKFLKKENFIYAYSDLQEFIFQQLEDKKLLQYYANEEWMRSDSKNANQNKDDFAGDGNIWFIVNNSKSKK